ncbi:DUF2000 domain-containing protein [Dactylosporangium sp. NPDC050588]|uniref:DUF2000 domain-containing protein n=1 Tax=Dactylosporangium sp. NPDC050588 TaxID=3157211 RepID=UPI003407E3DA
MTSPTKIAVLLRDDLAVWQRLNVTAFVVSGIAGTAPQLLGEDYADADGNRYLPMFGQPVMVFEGDATTLAVAHRRAVQHAERSVACATFTEELFKTGNDEDNRAAVRAVHQADLRLAGIAVHGPRNAVDRILKGARLHR